MTYLVLAVTALLGMFALFRLNIWRLERRVSRRVRALRRPVSRARPVLFVPGLLGTTLVDPAHRDFPVWGSYRGSFFYRKKFEDLDLPLDPPPHNRLVAGEVLWTFPVIPQLLNLPIYEEFARTLEGIGYERRDAGVTGDKPGLYSLCHDWRHGILASARALEDAVSVLRRTARCDQVHLVGHSWGSTIIRYYLRYGGANVLSANAEPPRPGGPAIATFFAVGAPYGGSLVPLHEINNGFAPGGPIGRKVHPHHMAAAPVAYELLPYDLKSGIDVHGNPVELDITNTDTWRRMEWGPHRPATARALHRRAQEGRPNLGQEEFNALVDTFLANHLQRGNRLWHRMRETDPWDDRVRTVTYVARNVRTLIHLIVDTTPAHPLTYSTPSQVERALPHLLPTVTSPGDGYVPHVQAEHYTAGRLRKPDEPIPAASYRFEVAPPNHRHLMSDDGLLADLIANIKADGDGVLD